ncbi:MAG: FAD-binding oxidoreductase [Pseudomonadota bacterium]
MYHAPVTHATPVTFASDLPPRADVVIIGGGVIGVCTAIYLAERGLRPVLIEKGRIAGEQSSRNWGWIRQQGRDAAELPIMVEAIGRWKELAAQTNVDFGLRQGGVTYMARTAKELAAFERFLPHAQAQGVDTRMLSGAETAAMFPRMAQPAVGAMTTPSDMRAEPWAAVPALAGIATRAGAQVIEGCAARGLDIAAGRVAGIWTEHGLIKTSNVVLAGGAWSSLFLRRHGVRLPQLAVRESVLATQPMPAVTEGAASLNGVAFRRRADGGYTLAPSGIAELFIGPDAFRALTKFIPQLLSNPLGQTYLPAAPRGFPDAWGTPRHWRLDEKSPFERMRVLDPAPNARQLRKLVAGFQALFPKLPEVQITARWAGMIDTMPDIVPVVDQCADLPGLTIGTGMSGHGFGIGPGMGRVLAALVTGAEAGHDLARFRLSRFSDGSALRPGP